MARLTLTEQADLDVYYTADSAHYAGQAPHVLEIVTREAFIALYRNCPSIGFACDGRAIGGMLFDGVQAHIAVLPEFHHRWALLWPRARAWMFSHTLGFVSDVEASNAAAIAFMERNGWPRVGSSESTVRFWVSPSLNRL